MQYISIQSDLMGLQRLFDQVQAYEWVFQWGMFIFLMLSVGIAIWIFMDSTQKNKADKALIPRIVSMVGAFLVSPAFIFRYTGNADAATLKVRLAGEVGAPFYDFPIPFNVKWLIAGYGPKIALLTLLGAGVSIVAAVIYSSTVSRQRLGTEFTRSLGNQFDSLRQEIDSVRASGAASNQTMAGAASAGRNVSSTIIEPTVGTGRVGTLIETPAIPGTATLRGVSGSVQNKSYNITAVGGRVGRDQANLIVVDDAKVSSIHAKIRCADGTWVLEDAASTNGSYVNDVRINGQSIINSNDRLRFGDSVFSFTVN